MSDFRRRMLNNLILDTMEDVRLIANITLENDMTGTIKSVTEDQQGKSLNLKEVFLRIIAKGPSENEQGEGGYDALIMNVNNSAYGLFYGEVALSNLPVTGKTMYVNGHTRALSNGYAICSKFQNEYENFNTSSTTMVERIYQSYWDSVNSIQIKTTSGKYLGKGSNIMIWGR